MPKHANKTKTRIAAVIQILSIIIAILCICYIVKWWTDNRKNKQLSEEIKEAIKIDEEIKVNDDEVKTFNVNFDTLKEKNQDTVAWLKVNGTNIEYPVVKTNNNDYYLSHSFDKSYNLAGWIFADYRNKLDGTDKNIVIYGHNIKDGSMFASLKNILTNDWYENKENRYIVFETLQNNKIYEVFSVYKIESEEYYTTTYFKHNFEEFVNELESRSVYDFNIELDETDKLLTLSTCDNNNKYRVVLHAREAIL